jgi:spore maturation protein CgeB
MGVRTLRIFQALSSSSNAQVGDSRTWYRNLHEPLVDLGHSVVLFPLEKAGAAAREHDTKATARVADELLAAVRTGHSKEPFDLFFSYAIDGMFAPEVVDEIRRLGIVTCNFSCNNTHQFGLTQSLAPHFDYNLHSEGDAAPKFRAIGATPLWWPMASNPKYFHPVSVQRDVAVSFVGCNYALRARYIHGLLVRNLDVHAFGPGWRFGARTKLRAEALRALLLGRAVVKGWSLDGRLASARLAELDFQRWLGRTYPDNLHDPVSDPELIALYSRSQVSLGFLEVFDNHDSMGEVRRHLHLREFEAPMCGALYCTGYCAELEAFFEPGREVVVYRSAEELAEKVAHYLRHPKEAEDIRNAARRRALADHTYHQRFETLFRAIGLRP